MAIGPIPVPVMPAAMDAFTAQMAGMSADQAYSAFMDQEYEVDSGVKIGYTTKTSTTPAITGVTEDSITSNNNPDPVDAWNDYVENEQDDVSNVSGGIVSGSNSTTMVYSILKNTNDDPEAVIPVGIPIDVAIVSVAQAVGVSIDAAQLDVETKQKFTNSIVQSTGMIYNKAKELVTAWKDRWGNILFPKSVVNAVDEVIKSEGIGGSSGYTSDLDTTPFTQPVKGFGTITVAEYFWRNNQWELYGVQEYSGVILAYGYRIFEYKAHGATVYSEYCNLKIGNKTGEQYSIDGSVYTAGSAFTHDGKSIGFTDAGAGASSPSSNWYYKITTPIPYAERSGNTKEALWTLIWGNPVQGGYPEGTSRSNAPSYSVEDLIERGSIKGANAIEIPVIPINIPDDPYNSTDSTKDPQDPTSDDNPGVLNPGYPGTIPDTKDPGGDNTKEGNVPIPLPIPDTNVSNPDVPLTDPSVIDSTLINELVDELANTLDPQPGQSSGIIPVPPMPGIQNIDPDTGLPDGTVSYPSIVPASGSGFIHVYNPTPAEFVSFGNWLWVTYADATIDKIWNNPFDGVIGAHELYATPAIEGRDNIRSGFLTCPTSANLVRNRYTEIDCGTVIVPEFYGNYLDYSPYSQAYIYLPFIGINEVSIDDIVGHAVNIRYRVDSYSGACIAMIFVAKDGYQNLCYQFAGSCSVEVPMAGGSQAAIKAGMMQAEAYARAAMVSAGGHLLGGIGSALMGSLGGALSSVAGIAGDYANAKAGVEAARVANKSSVQHSGQFGASHGAMGEKVPFIIIRNPVQVKVVNYNDDYGYPAHKRVIIGGCTGYLRVREVNVISAHATDDEKAAIEALLKNGVYVS